ncbi:hypothetical protein KY360_05685 [Candidatus Woesearchaeota archaeon]|nr:hypothetical protein [Candidatus Woesearchaeota archaeon]
MGLFSKLAFWKKEPELPSFGEVGKESGFKGPGGFGETGMGKGGAGEKGFGAEEAGGAPRSGFEQLGLGKEPGLAEVEPGMPEIEPGYGGGPGLQQQMMQQPMQRQPRQQRQQWPQQQAYAPMRPAQPATSDFAKDIEIVSSKLDALKASLDTINQRLENLERLATESQKRRW